MNKIVLQALKANNWWRSLTAEMKQKHRDEHFKYMHITKLKASHKIAMYNKYLESTSNT